MVVSENCHFIVNVFGQMICGCSYNQRHGLMCTRGCLFNLSSRIYNVSVVAGELKESVKKINRDFDNNIYTIEKALKGIENITRFLAEEALKIEITGE